MEELLKLARETLNSHFRKEKVRVPEVVKKKFSKNQACFVTLTKNKELRGCIGSLYPHQPLYEDVIDNTINAAFHDFRFSQVIEKELPRIKIEISVLSIPEKIEFDGPRELLEKIDKNMGIILKKGNSCSTFLPQVWEQLNDKIIFMEQLALKAGLFKDKWKDADIYSYRVEKLKEE